MLLPPIVYLDSQDYSRFGDVLRGKADTATEAVFNELEARKRSGNVIFALSMPILGELLQYNAKFRETTLKKAEAVERLCGKWALAHPTRLIAAEIAMAAQRLGLQQTSINTDVLSSDRYWHPNFTDIFDDLTASIVLAVNTEVATLPSRALRRRAARQARKFDFQKAVRDAAPLLAAKYELPTEVISDSFVAFAKGTISSDEASRRLFSHIAEPVSFVKTYFEKIESERALPEWMSTLGKDIQTALVEYREKLQPLLVEDAPRTLIMANFAEVSMRLGRMIISLAQGDTAEFGVDGALTKRFLVEPPFAAEVQACEIASAVFEAYFDQVAGHRDALKVNIEHSFGGDLIHALYLPHVDLWRGDRRFAALLTKSVPRYASRVVPLLKDLPARIDLLQRSARH
jgi:hypothetical protein